MHWHQRAVLTADQPTHMCAVALRFLADALQGTWKSTLQEDSSTPNRMLEHYPSDLESSLC